MMARTIRSSAPVASGVRSRVIQPSGAAGLVSGLVEFAGSAIPMVTEQINKKQDADKAIQMARAWQGQMPTDDATTAGYQASYLVAAKMRGMKSAKEMMADPSLGEYSDEEFEARVAESMGGIQSELEAEYPALKHNPELAKAYALQMSEMMPSVVDSRNAAQLQLEQKKRYSDIYALAFDSIEGAPPELAAKSLGDIMQASKSLQLSESQRERLILDLATATGDPGVFEFAKEYKGNSDSSLFSRSGKLQQLEHTTKVQLSHKKELEFWEDKGNLLGEYSKGSLTDEEFKAKSLELESLYGKGLSQHEFMSALSSRQKAVAVTTVQDSWMQDFNAGKHVGFIKPDGKRATKPEVEAFADRVQGDVFSSFSDEIRAADTPEGRASGELASVLDRAWRSTITQTDNLAIQSGEVSPKFKGRLSNIANMDVSTQIVKVKGPDGVERYTMPGVDETGAGIIYEGPADDFNLLARMPVSRLPAYASGDDLAILQKTRAYIDGGSSPAEAIMQAQYDVRKGTVAITGQRQKNIEALLDDPTDAYFWSDSIPDSARAMMIRNLSQSTINFDSADYQKSAASEEMSNQYTYLSDNSPIKGSTNLLRTGLTEELIANGVDADVSGLSLDDYFGTARTFMLPFAKTHFRNENLKEEDIQFDVQDGFVRFVSGDKVLPYKVSIGRLGSMVYKYKKDNYVYSAPASLPAGSRPGRIPTN